MATKDRTALKDEFKNGNLATGERFADLIDSMKVVQLPVADPAASGTSLSFIDSISQDADGKITATKKTLDLANAHELNPFKGWYKTGDTLPTDGFDGAYLYFKDTSELTGQTTIYRWNGTAYTDTGTVVDTSNVQTFETGQAVSGVAIDDTALVNPAGNALAKAADGMLLAAKLQALDLVESKASFTAQKAYFNAKTRTITSSNVNRLAEIPIIEGYNRFRFRGADLKNENNSLFFGYGFKSGNDFIYSKAYDGGNGVATKGKEYIVDIPPTATSFVVQFVIGGVSALTEDNFYCYFQKGKSMTDVSEKVFEVKAEKEIQGYVSNRTGDLIINTIDNYTVLYPVSVGSKVVLYASNVNHPACYFSFYNENTLTNGNLISVVGKKYNYYKGANVITVPQDANYLGVTYRFSGEGELSYLTVCRMNPILETVLDNIDTVRHSPELEKWGGIKWVAFGDSLTESNYRATKNYHDYVHDWTGITVVNRGVSGSGYKELYSSSKAFYQRVRTQTDSDAGVITIFGSGNDLHRQNGVLKYEIGDVTDTGTDTICGCINDTLDWLQQNFPLVPLGIVTPTPWRSQNQVPSNLDASNKMTEYCNKLIAICEMRGIPYLDLYHCSNLHPESNAFCGVAYRRDATYAASSQGVDGAIEVTEELLPIVQEFGLPNAAVGDWVLPTYSGVHPDEAGHRFIAPRFKAFLETLIEK